VSDADSINDYLRNLVSEDVYNLGLSDEASEAVIDRVIGSPGAQSVVTIKKMVPKEKQAIVSNFVKSSEDLLKTYIEPIELAIHKFSVEVLNGVKSILMNDSDKEVVRLRNEVSRAMDVIKASNNEVMIDVLDKQMKKLGGIENITTAIEGIVFSYKGQVYKMTGSFAPINQILALFKYGKNGVKVDMGEALVRRAVQRMLNEGGHAFSDVKPISIDDLGDTFERVKENFVNVFHALFTQDDMCDMKLVDPSNPAETTIEIYAQPKGKKPSTITQLSGGEKTLTSAAFLFAIYLIKPAPFCILDEVDAPLDDANVGKFTNMIRQFSDNSQFIIVTHNKQTMASVDVIYGVTMQEAGVSKLVPVDFRSLN
jgi:hypothetical protein